MLFVFFVSFVHACLSLSYGACTHCKLYFHFIYEDNEMKTSKDILNITPWFVGMHDPSMNLVLWIYLLFYCCLTHPSFKGEKRWEYKEIRWKRLIAISLWFKVRWKWNKSIKQNEALNVKQTCLVITIGTMVQRVLFYMRRKIIQNQQTSDKWWPINPDRSKIKAQKSHDF